MRTNLLKKSLDSEDDAGWRLPDPVRRPLAQLSVPFDDDRHRSGRLGQLAASFGTALILELAVVIGIWSTLSSSDTHSDSDDVVELSMVQLPATPPEPNPAPPSPKRAEVTKVNPMTVHPIMRSPPKVAISIPALPDKISHPSPPVPAPSPTASAAAIDQFQAEVRAAIQTAIVYPPTARMMHQQGRTKVAFTLIHGHANGAQVTQSSGTPAIDTAALAAVNNAVYPVPPPEMAEKPLPFAVFVVFSLASR